MEWKRIELSQNHCKWLSPTLEHATPLCNLWVSLSALLFFRQPRTLALPGHKKAPCWSSFQKSLKTSSVKKFPQIGLVADLLFSCWCIIPHYLKEWSNVFRLGCSDAGCEVIETSRWVLETHILPLYEQPIEVNAGIEPASNVYKTLVLPLN